MLAIAFAAALFAGCGGGGDDETAQGSSSRPLKVTELNMTLDGDYSPQNVGVLMAAENGYFADAGLYVAVNTPVSPLRPIPYVVSHTVDLGISQSPEVALAREEGERIVAVGSLLTSPTDSMIWLKRSKIHGIADLRGKTIAIPGLPYQEDFLRSVLEGAGLSLSDVKVRRAAYDLVPDLVSGRADAIFGGAWNVEGVGLEARGLNPVVIRPEELGIPAYDERVVIVRSELAAEDPELIRKFMAALVKGSAAAAEDPKAALEALLATGVGRKSAEAELAATLPLLSTSGYMDPSRVAGLTDWMYEEGMLRRPLPVPSVFDNGYLPKS